jgi:tRNA 2-thiouridine synthesizing protein A
MADVQIDCRDLNCPMPIVRVSQKMKTMLDGQTLEVTATDPAFGADVRAWVNKMGHELLGLEQAPVQTAVIRKLATGRTGK